MDSLPKILQKPTTKYKETCTNTDHSNTYAYLENEKLIAI